MVPNIVQQLTTTINAEMGKATRNSQNVLCEAWIDFEKEGVLDVLWAGIFKAAEGQSSVSGLYILSSFLAF